MTGGPPGGSAFSDALGKALDIAIRAVAEEPRAPGGLFALGLQVFAEEGDWMRPTIQVFHNSITRVEAGPIPEVRRPGFEMPIVPGLDEDEVRWSIPHWPGGPVVLGKVAGVETECLVVERDRWVRAIGFDPDADDDISTDEELGWNASEEDWEQRKALMAILIPLVRGLREAGTIEGLFGSAVPLVFDQPEQSATLTCEHTRLANPPELVDGYVEYDRAGLDLEASRREWS